MFFLAASRQHHAGEERGWAGPGTGEVPGVVEARGAAVAEEDSAVSAEDRSAVAERAGAGEARARRSEE